MSFSPQPATAGPKPKIPSDELRPGRWWYLLSGLAVVATLAGAIALFASGGERVSSLASVFTELTAFEAPGETTVQLEAGDEQAIYRQTFSGFGQVPGGQALTELRCRVADPGGAAVPLDETLGLSTLDLNQNRYVTEFTFEAAQSGEYAVRCTLPGGGQAGLLVGPEVKIGEIFGLVGSFLLGVAVLLLGLAVAAAIAVPVAVMRWRHRARLQNERMGISA